MTIEDLKLDVHTRRNELKRCPVCNGNIEDRQVALYKGLIRTLYSVYVWCKTQGKHEFTTKEIRGIMSHNDYARFGDLVRFGGIVYKPNGDDGKSHKALYGINMERAAAFFQGTYRIPVQITIDQITNMIIDEITVDIKDFPELYKLLDAQGLYDPKKPAVQQTIL
jgi:hypothetical protein